MVMSACCDLCSGREHTAGLMGRPGLEIDLEPRWPLLDTPLRLWNIQTFWSPRRTCAQAGAPLPIVISA